MERSIGQAALDALRLHQGDAPHLHTHGRQGAGEGRTVKARGEEHLTAQSQMGAKGAPLQGEARRAQLLCKLAVDLQQGGRGLHAQPPEIAAPLAEQAGGPDLEIKARGGHPVHGGLGGGPAFGLAQKGEGEMKIVRQGEAAAETLALQPPGGPAELFPQRRGKGDGDEQTHKIPLCYLVLLRPL